MHTNLFAYTPVDASPPPFLSVNREDNGKITIHVRGTYHPAVHTEVSMTPPHQDQASIEIDEETAMDLVSELFSHLFFKKGSPL